MILLSQSVNVLVISTQVLSVKLKWNWVIKLHLWIKHTSGESSVWHCSLAWRGVWLSNDKPLFPLSSRPASTSSSTSSNRAGSSRWRREARARTSSGSASTSSSCPSASSCRRKTKAPAPWHRHRYRTCADTRFYDFMCVCEYVNPRLLAHVHHVMLSVWRVAV